MTTPSPFNQVKQNFGEVTKIFIGIIEEFQCPEDFQIDVKLPYGHDTKCPAFFLKHRDSQQALLFASGLEQCVNLAILDKSLQDLQPREYVYENPAMVEHLHIAMLELIERYRAKHNR